MLEILFSFRKYIVNRSLIEQNLYYNNKQYKCAIIKTILSRHAYYKNEKGVFMVHIFCSNAIKTLLSKKIRQILNLSLNYKIYTSYIQVHQKLGLSHASLSELVNTN